MAHQRFGPGPLGAGNDPIVGSGTSAVGRKPYSFWRNKGTRRRAAGRMSGRILVVAPQPFFTPRGTPFSVYYRTLVSSELGFEVDLLTYGQGEDIDMPGVRLIRAPAFAWLGPVKIGPSMLKLWLDIFLMLRCLGCLLRQRYAIVHAHEEAVFLLRFLKPIFRFKLIYDMHSSLPEQLSNYRFTSSRLLIGLFETLEASCLKSADAVITICPELARYAQPLMPDPSRHFLIENSIFEPVRLAAATTGATSGRAGERLEPPTDRQVVLYAGTFEVYQGLETLVEAFAIAHSSCPQSLLVLMGGTPEQVKKLKALARAQGIEEHVRILERMPKDVAARFTAVASVLISPRSHGTNTPLKIYEQLASGVPLVATRILSHTQVLTEDVAFLVDPEPRAMAQGLIHALTDQERRDRVVARARALYETAYSRPVYEGKMRAVFDRLGAHPSVERQAIASPGKA
jgi:glycosyltransferase involved in cell wall biosynthesis